MMSSPSAVNLGHRLALYSISAAALGMTQGAQAEFTAFTNSASGGLPIVVDPDTADVELDIDNDGNTDFILRNSPGNTGTWASMVGAEPANQVNENAVFGSYNESSITLYGANITGSSPIGPNLVDASTSNNFWLPTVLLYGQYSTQLAAVGPSVIGLMFQASGSYHYGCLVISAVEDTNNAEYDVITISAGGFESQPGVPSTNGCNSIANTIIIDGFESPAQ